MFTKGCYCAYVKQRMMEKTVITKFDTHNDLEIPRCGYIFGSTISNVMVAG